MSKHAHDYKLARNIQTTKSIKKEIKTMNMIEGLRLNLQFFSQDDIGGSNPSDDNVDDTKEDKQYDQTNDKDKDKKEKDEKTFTQKELDDIVQQRVKRAEKEKQDAIDEAKKLAKMNAEEKKDYELEKLQRENEELKAAQNKYALGKEASNMLSESGIIATDEILDFVVREDAEKTSEAVKAFSDLVDRVSDERMKEKLKGNPPKRQTGQQTSMTKEEIMKIKDTEKRQKLIRENIHLFQ